jgi:hypothetical protein
MSEYVQAIVKSDTGGFRFTDVQRPVRRTESDILIRVSNISLNRGELDFPGNRISLPDGMHLVL